MKKSELIAEIKNLTEIIEERNAFIRNKKEEEKWKIIDDFKDNILKIGGSNVDVTMQLDRSCDSIFRSFKLEFTL
jgi:hypothetical protein